MFLPARAAGPGGRTEEASLEVADDSAAESDVGERRRLLRGEGAEGKADGSAPRPPARGCRSAAVASASLLLAAAAAALWPRRAALASRGRGEPGAAVSVAALTEYRHMCEDRDTFRLALGTYTSQASCLDACEHTSGCTGYSYQANECPELPGGIMAGSCYLWHKKCPRLRDNSCFDHFEMGSNLYPATWSLVNMRTGCSNWRKIQLKREPTFKNPSFEMSAGACGLRCHRTPNCTHFNFQVGACSGSEMVGKGACLLFNGDCKPENNTCWDLYRKVNLTSRLMDDVAAGATSLPVNSSAGLFAGDVVVISGDAAAEAEETRTITGFGPGSVIVGLALDNDHPADSTVTKQAVAAQI